MVHGKLFLACLLSFSQITKGWYVCDEKPFCQKIRNADFGPTPYRLDPASFETTPSTFTVELRDRNTNSLFKLKVEYLENDIFHVNIDDPSEPRHAFPEALNGSLRLGLMDVDGQTEEAFRLTSRTTDTSAKVYVDPFKIEVYDGVELIVSLNEGGKLVINTREDDISISLDAKFYNTRVAYGIPLHAERLSLKTTQPGGLHPYRLFNVDHCCYAVDSQEPLYGAIPVMYAHGPRRSSGLFWLNSAQTFVDVDRNVEDQVGAFFISESGVLDLFVLPGPTLRDATVQYTTLTGTAPLPPLFAMAHHQSRYSYMSQMDLLTVVEEFDNHDFPLDVMWLDIDYTDSYKYFTWDYTAFPEPEEMQRTLDIRGRKLVVIIDPHFKVDEDYFVYQIGTERGYFVMNPDGSVFEGECWPGLSRYLDFHNPEARAWYSSLYHFGNFPNATENLHLWNDMNEPVVFDQEEQTMPNNLVHYGGVPHRDIHNTYGFMQTMGTWQGLMDRSGGQKRPFILTRSHFAGSQRFAAIWTGDNLATWEHLKVSIPMCLSEALAGVSFCGADVGGFVDDVDDQLLQRWYQTGAWLPFFRQHSSVSTTRREPYLYPQNVQAVFRKALHDRYVHLPYWYTVWYEHERYGDPVIRPLTYHYPQDTETLEMDNQWLVGQDILVQPVTDENALNVRVYMPGGFNQQWFDIEQNLVYRGMGFYTVIVPLDYTPVFYRGGSIITRKDTPRPSSELMRDDGITLYVFLDENQFAAGNIYVDDYESFEYRRKNYLYVRFEYQFGSLSGFNIDPDAEFTGDAHVSSVRIYRPPSRLSMNDEITVAEFQLEEGLVQVSGLKLKLNAPFRIQLEH